jgi:hypothetical protein
MAALLVGSTLPSGARLANHLIATGSFGHRPNNRYGENLYSISGGAASPALMVSNWAREARG